MTEPKVSFDTEGYSVEFYELDGNCHAIVLSHDENDLAQIQIRPSSYVRISEIHSSSSKKADSDSDSEVAKDENNGMIQDIVEKYGSKHAYKIWLVYNLGSPIQELRTSDHLHVWWVHGFCKCITETRYTMDGSSVRTIPLESIFINPSNSNPCTAITFDHPTDSVYLTVSLVEFEEFWRGKIQTYFDVALSEDLHFDQGLYISLQKHPIMNSATTSEHADGSALSIKRLNSKTSAVHFDHIKDCGKELMFVYNEVIGNTDKYNVWYVYNTLNSSTFPVESDDNHVILKVIHDFFPGLFDGSVLNTEKIHHTVLKDQFDAIVDTMHTVELNNYMLKIEPVALTFIRVESLVYCLNPCDHMFEDLGPKHKKDTESKIEKVEEGAANINSSDSDALYYSSESLSEAGSDYE